MLAFYVQDVVLNLERKLVGIAIGAATSIAEPFKTAFLITIKDLVPGFARDAEFPAKVGYRLAS